MKHQRNVILRNMVLLLLGAFCLTALGFLVGKYVIHRENFPWEPDNALLDWIRASGWKTLDVTIGTIYLYAAGFFWAGYGVLYCFLILSPILTLILVISALFLLHREHPNAQRSGANCLRGALQLNRLMACLGLIWALVGTVAPYFPGAWGILTMALPAAGFYLLRLGFGLQQRLSLLLEKTWEENQNSLPDSEEQNRLEMKNRKLFVLMVFLSGLVLGLSLLLGRHGDLILSFSERFDRMTGELTGGGIFFIPLGILCIFIDLGIYFPAMGGFFLFMPLSMILAVVFALSTKGNRQKKGRNFARGILILETIAAAAQGILIVVGLFDGWLPGVTKLLVCPIYLTGFLLLLRGYWILPELPLTARKEV